MVATFARFRLGSPADPNMDHLAIPVRISSSDPNCQCDKLDQAESWAMIPIRIIRDPKTKMHDPAQLIDDLD